MTIKVYMADGTVEEYPNAHITWEWDDNNDDGNLGTDSGFRINAIDRNFTSVSAFVYPSEFEKIEITPEKSDMIFKRAPEGTYMTAKRLPVYMEINNERERQIEKYGEQNHPMHKTTVFTAEAIKELSREIKSVNDREDASWLTILIEEIYEAFAETEPEKQRGEMVQVAAVAVQIIEYLDRRIVDAKE